MKERARERKRGQLALRGMREINKGERKKRGEANEFTLFKNFN
jgi:hypothetical protein